MTSHFNHPRNHKAAYGRDLMKNMNFYFSLRQQIDREISKIPKKNRPKFQADYLKLIQLAQKDNYENYNLPG